MVVTSTGNTPKRQAVNDALTTLLKRHGLRHRSFHSVRHFFCTTLLQRGADIELVRVVAGHSDVATTMRYLHARAEAASVFMVPGPTKALESVSMLN